MAEKTQLIRIKFVQDTSELNNATAAAQRAQAATDKLRDSAAKVGTEAAAGNKKWQSSIGSVRIELERQRALIESTSRSDTKLLNERIAKYKQLQAEVDKFNKKLQDTEKVTKTVNNGFKSLLTSVGLVFSAALIRQVVNTALEMAKLSGNIEGVERAFYRLPNAALLLDNLRRGTHGTVNDLELMQKALQANNFRIPLQQLGVLFEFAATKAQQTGQEVNHLVDYIVSGIGYRSIKRLDDLGFTANRVKEALGGVSLQAASMQQVMYAVTQLMNEDLAKTGGYADTAATDVGKLSTALNELYAAAAQKITNTGALKNITAGLQEVRDVVEGFPTDDYLKILYAPYKIFNFVDKWVEGILKVKRDQAVLEEALNRTRNVQERLNGTEQQNVDIIAQTLIQNTTAIRQREQEIEKLTTKNKLIQLQYEAGKLTIQQQVAQQGANNKMISGLQFNVDVLKQVNVQLKDFMTTIQSGSDTETLGLIAAKMQEIEDAGDRLKDAKSANEIHKVNLELSRLNAELADLKAIGTTKQFLEVDGKIRLVPVVDPKTFKKTIEQEPIFKQGVSIPISFDASGNATGFKSGTRSAGDQLADDIERQLNAALKNIPPPKVQVEITPTSSWDKIGQEFADNWRDVLSQGLSDTGNFLMAVVDAEASEYDQRINQARNYYDNLLTLAGDNENQKGRIRLKAQKEEDKLRREAFEADKRAKRSQALINGAVGVTQAFATLPYPAAVVAAALIAASTIAQVAAINKEKPRFAKGKVNIQGPGTKTSDSIEAKISRGESVINAGATERSAKLLEGINSGRIDDRVLNRLHLTKDGVKFVGMDDTRMVRAIKGLQQPDFVRIGSDIYEVKKSSDGLSKRLRRKTMSR